MVWVVSQESIVHILFVCTISLHKVANLRINNPYRAMTLCIVLVSGWLVHVVN